MNDLTRFRCPECGSDRVTVSHVQLFMVNTGEHFCHSIKTQDSNSPALCLDCQWEGERKDLIPARDRFCDLT